MSEERELLDSEGRPLVEGATPSGYPIEITPGGAARLAQEIHEEPVLSSDDARVKERLARAVPGGFPRAYDERR